MSRITSELKRRWVAWLVVFVSVGTKLLVNQVEQPFARSLVTCDSALNGTYTGSLWCGDRLTVLNEGYRISAVGQGQESFAMLCSITFVAVVAGAFGRKPALLLGLAGTTASVALFLLATASPGHARALFAAGQGLQGAYPHEYITGMVLLDLSRERGADGQAVYEVAQILAVGGQFLWQLVLGNVVQMLELSDYTLVWVVILAVNFAVLLIAVIGFPNHKTDAGKGKVAEGVEATSAVSIGPLRKVMEEVNSYRSMAHDWRARRYLAAQIPEYLCNVYHMSLLPVGLMAYHGWNQSDTIKAVVFVMPASLLCMPIVGKILIPIFGYHRTYMACCGMLSVVTAVSILWWPVSGRACYLWLLSACLISGFHPLRNYVDGRFAEPEHMGRMMSVKWIMGYFTGVFLLPAVASIFDAKAVSFFDRLRPACIPLFGLVATLVSVYWLIYDMDGVNGIGVTLKVMDVGTAKATRLWHLVTQGGSDLTEELYQEFGLDKVFMKPLSEINGPFCTVEKFVAGLGNLNKTPAEGQWMLKALDTALASAEEKRRTLPEPSTLEGKKVA